MALAIEFYPAMAWQEPCQPQEPTVPVDGHLISPIQSQFIAMSWSNVGNNY